jgi:hypothetical protein
MNTAGGLRQRCDQKSRDSNRLYVRPNLIAATMPTVLGLHWIDSHRYSNAFAIAARDATSAERSSCASRICFRVASKGCRRGTKKQLRTGS